MENRNFNNSNTENTAPKDTIPQNSAPEDSGIENFTTEDSATEDSATEDSKKYPNQKDASHAESCERVLLAGVNCGKSEHDFNRSMEELKNLAEAHFMKPVGMVTQKMDSPNKALYIGTGKVQEVKETALLSEADAVVFDDTLTPSQLSNLQKELDMPVMDRTALILDIFATRAQTREAKLQVESARLKYLLPRLVGMHQALTRQGGTSGSMSSRGAGEKKLELDRRRIEQRITELNRDLKEIANERAVQRKTREESRLPLVALAGYTNSGKSTIMNAMIDTYMKNDEKRVLEKDMLFATLDTAVRRICTGNSRDFLLSDTVGFIHKLPHALVRAFHATLEELESADLILHVIDYSDPDHREQMETTKEILSQLKTAGIPMITVYNKADKCRDSLEYPKIAGSDKIYISAREADSIELLTGMILDKVYEDYVQAEFLIPYQKGDITSYFMENTHIAEQAFEENGTRLKVRCHQADAAKYAQYRIS